jgi:hypothetical protein
MLADKIIKLRDEYIDNNHAQAICTAYDKCLDDIEACVIAGEPISVQRSRLEIPEVTRALSYIGFTLGEEFHTCKEPHMIGVQQCYRVYLIPT